MTIMQHCAGGIVLGFEQTRLCIHNGQGNVEHSPLLTQPVPKVASFPTPWNHLEAGMMFARGLPMLVFKDAGINGGIFDTGVTDVFIHTMPKEPMAKAELDALDLMFQNWAARVRRHYYGE